MVRKYRILISMFLLLCCTLKAEPVIYLYGADADKAYRLTNSNDFDQEMTRSCPENTTASKTPGLKFAASLFLSFGVCSDELDMDENRFSELKNGFLEHLNRKEYTLILLVDDFNQNLTDKAIKNLKKTNGREILEFNSHKQRWKVLTGSITLDREAIGEITGQQYFDKPVKILVVGEREFHSEKINRQPIEWLNFIASSSEYIGCEISENNRIMIGLFGQKLYEYKHSLRKQMISGLHSFSTSMSFSSKKSSVENYDNVIDGFILEFGKGLGDALLEENLLVKITVGATLNAIENGAEERARANKAGESFKMGKWINDTREKITDCVDEIACPVFSDDFKQQLLEQVCSIPKGVQRDRAISHMVNKSKKGAMNTPQPASFYTKIIYEKWISSHNSKLNELDNSMIPNRMKSFSLSYLTSPDPIVHSDFGYIPPPLKIPGQSNNGLIDILVDEKTQKVLKIKVVAPGFSNRAESAMEDLPYKIRDYKVFKRVCVRRKASLSTVSKKSQRFCIVYNKNNKVLAEPLKDDEKKIALRNIPSQYLNYKKFGDF